MIRADKYAVETLKELMETMCRDRDVRAKYADGVPATTKFITQKVFSYDISEGEFPITTLRNTALKGAFYDIEAIYIKQTNILEEMHPSIHDWWKDFTTFVDEKRDLEGCIERHIAKFGEDNILGISLDENYEYKKYHTLGETYGAIVKKYALMDKLLKGLEENPFGRRHIIDMWQYTEQNRSPESLVPCAFQTMWSIRELGKERYIDLTLTQRSQDFLMTMSINPAQYVMLGIMVCNHLTFKTGVKHSLGKFLHVVQNLHMYERHIPAAKEMLARDPINQQPTMELVCGPKDFYEHSVEDFKFNLPNGIKKLSTKLELAI